MDFSKILPVLLKGIGLAQVAVNQGQSAAPVMRAMSVLLRKSANGTITAAELEQTESDLDGLIDRFNRPI